jgi:hypothetical protein
VRRSRSPPGYHDMEWSRPAYARVSASTCEPQIPAYRAPRVLQLQRWLVEIIALNLDADFTSLNVALNEDKSTARIESILSTSEEEQLEMFSRASITTRQQLEQDQPIDELETWLLLGFIIKPSREIYAHCDDFVMEILGWYCESRSNPTPSALTLPNFWQSEVSARNVSLGSYVGYMRSFKTLIHQAAANSEVRFVLERALEKCCRDGGFEMIESEIYFLPIKCGYAGLSKAVEQGPK